MSKQTEEVQKLLDKLGPDEGNGPVEIGYTDGTMVEFHPCHREMLEQQLELHKLADKYIDEMIEWENSLKNLPS
jgi:hypothetical protein